MSIQEGTFLGDAKHKDGSLMAVVFQVRSCMQTNRDAGNWRHGNFKGSIQNN